MSWNGQQSDAERIRPDNAVQYHPIGAFAVKTVEDLHLLSLTTTSLSSTSAVPHTSCC
jgi:hypothetical protein